jgi:hypothetical protein
MIKIVECAKLNENDEYCFTKVIYFLKIKIYEYTFISTKTEYIKEYKSQKIGF